MRRELSELEMKVSHLYRLAGIAGLGVGVLNVVVEFLPGGVGGPLKMVINAVGLWVLAALYSR